MVLEILSDALRNIRTHWFRVFLTGFGIVWGIALFVALNAAGNGIRDHYREKMEIIGRKAIYTFPGVVAKKGAGSRNARRVTFDLDDPPRLTGSPLIERAAPELWTGPRILKGGGHIKIVWTYGVAPEAQQIRNFEVGRGRFITPADVAAHGRVLVIGAKVEERLFGRRSALGAKVHLDGYPFRIVGVSAPKGEQLMNMGPRDDEQVLMPITTAQSLFTGSDEIGYLLFDPRTRDDGIASIRRARTILSRHHSFEPSDEEAVSFFNTWDAIRLVETIGFALQLFLVACGVLTLAAGSIGVMNIMLVAVGERTREIGLRKALGATDRDILIQVLGETVVITVAAGLAGLCLGSVIIWTLKVLRQAAPDADLLVPPIVLSPTLALLAFAVLVTAGLLAGMLPAVRAARLDPSAALRED